MRLIRSIGGFIRRCKRSGEDDLAGGYWRLVAEKVRDAEASSGHRDPSLRRDDGKDGWDDSKTNDGFYEGNV
jgi:hypothetical protein